MLRASMSQSKTKRVEGTVHGLNFFAEIKKRQKYSRRKILFFCHKCKKHVLLKNTGEIQDHLKAHREESQSV
jgi:hypothetical protein